MAVPVSQYLDTLVSLIIFLGFLGVNLLRNRARHPAGRAAAADHAMGGRDEFKIDDILGGLRSVATPLKPTTCHFEFAAHEF